VSEALLFSSEVKLINFSGSEAFFVAFHWFLLLLAVELVFLVFFPLPVMTF